MTNMIRNRTRAALGAALVAGTLAGCVDFTGPGIDTNPNQPSSASRNSLFAASQAFGQVAMTGDINRLPSVWMQQMAGVNRQWLSLNRYEITENTQGFDLFYGSGAGGLIDLRNIQAQSRGANDKTYLGIAQVYEALLMSYVADGWGNVPYRQAVNFVLYPQPALTRQDTVYMDLQVLLDSALANLATGTGTGPLAVDLVYGGDRPSWIAMARTLKARLYLHTAESVGAAAYTAALTQATAGIGSAAGDYATYHSNTTGEENQWFQFRRNRGTDISAGKFLVDLLVARADPRISDYFATEGGVYKGADPGDEDDGTFSWLSGTRADGGFRQPLVTYAENAHIKAEAEQRGGADATALATLNTYRGTVSLAALAAGGTDCGGGPCTGTPLLQEILTSKYIALFQNYEVWNDYKRTCWPNLVKNTTAVAPTNFIPGRFYFGASERQTNSKIPSVSAQQASPRNFMDPMNATTIGGGACLGN